MNNQKFLQQVCRKLYEQLENEIKLADDCIEVFEGDKIIFKVDKNGGMFYSADKQFSNTVDAIHSKIEHIVCVTKEYMNAMDNSPDLSADHFNMPYKKLLEYNNVVLAGTEHNNGSFEFVTWRYKNNSLDNGHYYEDYEKAKSDFAERSGLLPENQIYSDDERFELYRCIEDTLSLGFKLNFETEETLEKLREKLRESIPDFDNRLMTLDEQEQAQEQTM